MFLGQCFANTSKSLVSSVASSSVVSTLTVKNSIFDEVYASVSISPITDFDGAIPSKWTFDTRLHVLFNGDLHGGNVKFSESIVESVRIKVRTKKDNKFKTIYEKPITCNDDFVIRIMDYYEPKGVIEYAYVPIISGGENDYILNSVESDFDSYFLCEKGISYPMILDTQFNKKLNQRIGVVETWGRKYPVVIRNGNLRYYTGDIECTFIDLKDCIWKVDDGWDYRNAVYEFLTNGNPKVLKDFEGNIWMMAVTSAEIDETKDHWQHVTSRFSVTECGDAYDVGDLYDNGFIDTDLDR